MKISICGSTLHEKEMRLAADELKRRGYEVATPAFGEAQVKVASGFDVEKKEYYIRRHFANIDESDAILVVNHEKNSVANYVGGNTLLEIGHAYTQGLEIFFVNPIPEIGYKDELMGMRPIIIDGDLSKIDEYFADLPRAYISSESPVKHTAISRALRRAGLRVQLKGMKVASGVNEQPQSIDETYEGAMTRHVNLKQAAKTADAAYFVTIESGNYAAHKNHNVFGVEVTILEKAGSTPKVGIEVNVELPRAMTDKVPSVYPDLGVLVQQEYDSKLKDPIPFFTDGKLTRAKLLENAMYNIAVQLEAQEHED